MSSSSSTEPAALAPAPPGGSPLRRAWDGAARLSPLQVGLLATLALALLQAVVRNGGPAHGDDRIYELMAEDPFATHTFPFAYRIGVPTLVHVLPFSHDVSFTLIALASAGAAAGFLYALMTSLETPPRVAAAAALLFAISPGVLVALLRNGRSVDPATLLAMSAAAYFVVRRRMVPLMIALACGALVRESAMFMIPFAYAVWAERWIDWPALRRVLLVSLPAIAIYVALRLSLPTVGSELVLGYGDGPIEGRLTLLREGFADPVTSLRRIALAFGPLWLVAPFALKRMRYAQRGLVLVGLCVVSMTFALDWGRVILLAAPAIYPAATWVLGRRPRLRAPILLLWLVVCLGYAGYMDLHGVASNIDGGVLPPYPVR